MTKRRSYRDWEYWAKPIPGFGDHAARIVIVGLAPAAHGANRTGRMFTGDRSGDFLYAALHRAGLANQPLADSLDDGLALRNVYITAALRCAPPGNKPTVQQLSNCSSYLVNELAILGASVTICLGSLAWNAVLSALRDAGERLPKPKPKFSHAVQCAIGPAVLLGCYHVSQQNTFTGRLTEPMIDAVLARAKGIAAGEGAL